MVSAAEQLAANLKFSTFAKADELKQRLLFTLGMLAVYRVGVFVTIPGVDRNVMQAVVSKQGGGLLGLFNLFSGGALGNLVNRIQYNYVVDFVDVSARWSRV